MKTLTYILPAYWASYLINGDASGLEDSERAVVDSFMVNEGNPNIVDCGEPYFSRRNDATLLAGDVCIYTALDRGLDNIPQVIRSFAGAPGADYVIHFAGRGQVMLGAKGEAVVFPSHAKALEVATMLFANPSSFCIEPR